jgi:hypothetical protein
MRFLLIATALFIQVQSDAAQASLLQVERFSGDATFVDRCGGSDTFGCEWLVAEGRAGNRASGGTWERGFFDRIDNAVVNADADAGSDFNAANPFTLSYDGLGTSALSFLGGPLFISSIDFGTSYGGDNPTAPAQSIYLRVRDAELSGLTLTTGGSSHAIDSGLLEGIGAPEARYLAVSGFDVAGEWILSGTALLGSGSNSGSAFQLKVTDLAMNRVPLPATVWLVIVAGSGLLCRRFRAA